MKLFNFVAILLALSFIGLTGCSSGQSKRKEQQTQVVKSSKIYCEFVNGENQQDVDVVLNLQMGARCDFEKPYTMTSYKTPADITGVMFCCGVVGEKSEKPEKKLTAERVMEAPKEVPKEIPVVPAAMPPVQDAPELKPEPAAVTTAPPAAPKVEERKPNAVKPVPKPAAKAPAKANPYSDLDL